MLALLVSFLCNFECLGPCCIMLVISLMSMNQQWWTLLKVAGLPHIM